MELRVIKTRAQHQRYLREVRRLMRGDPHPRTPEGSRLELMAVLIEAYEKEQFQFGTPDPVEALEFRMEQMGLKQKDIAEILGGKNRASEVLARRRPLTLAMIRALREKLDISSESLIREPVAEYRVNRKSSKARK